MIGQMIGQPRHEAREVPELTRFERAVHRRWVAGSLVVLGFRFLGWSAVTVLTVLGLFVVAFALIGNLTFDGFVAALANLADRYVAADSGRRASFRIELAILWGVLLVGVSVLRRGGLARIVNSAGEP